MYTERQLREKIMRRVWGVYFVRQLTSPLLRLGVIAMVFIGIVSSVSMKNILENMTRTSGLQGLARFFVDALFTTSFTVQALCLVAAVLIVWYSVDAIRGILYPHSLRTSV